jgi:phosphoribosylaminoimidazolecarboxamide formyltransferase/IMP cyclohydrolase
MVVVNLYPFQQTVSRPDASVELARGNIDIGGPCMIRASAKNFIRVAPLVDPADYDSVLEQMEQTDGCTTLDLRFRLAGKAFNHTAEYDRAIADFLNDRSFADVKGCYRM